MASRKGGGPAVEEEAAGPLQAVLLADSFTQKFRPITLDRPKVLLPLVNVPMIDYTLEWLATAGVEEIFVFCCAHYQQLTSHVDRHWKQQPGLKVTCIVALDCVSAGDALRHIDQKGVIRNDFVLVSGDTVSNMSLEKPLKEHRERRKRDKQAVMTMVVRRSKPHSLTHQTRLGNTERIYAINSESKQLLMYDYGQGMRSEKENLAAQRSSHVLTLDRALVEEQSSVQVRTDLQDCYVDICSPEVLMLFTDNFDYQDTRRDFVKGLLSDEVMGNKIYTCEITCEYAARIDNLRAYDVVSRDIIHRWLHPLVPETQLGSHTAIARVDRGNRYREENVQLSRTAAIGENTVLGEGTVVGDGTAIMESVVGRNCVIGNNVVIEGSYLWNGVVLEDGVHIKHAVLCEGVVVKRGAILEPGVVLSFKVVIGPNFRVPAYSKISLQAQPTEEDSSDEEREYSEQSQYEDEDESREGSSWRDHLSSSPGESASETQPNEKWKEEEVGRGGAGCSWHLKEGARFEEEWRHSVAPIPQRRWEELSALKEEEREEEEALPSGAELHSTQSNIEDSEEEEEEDEFEVEVQELFQRTVDEGATFDNIVLEINALKLGLVRTFADCAGAVFRCMLSLGLKRAASQSPKDVLASTRDVMKKWGPLLRRFLKQQDDEVEVLLSFEEECSEGRQVFAPIFSNVLTVLYDYDIVTEESIMAWADEKADAEESEKTFLRQSEQFIQWLKEADEEGSDEEDEVAVPSASSKTSTSAAKETVGGNKSGTGTVKTEAKVQAKEPKEEEEDDEDEEEEEEEEGEDEDEDEEDEDEEEGGGVKAGKDEGGVQKRTADVVSESKSEESSLTDAAVESRASSHSEGEVGR